MNDLRHLSTILFSLKPPLKKLNKEAKQIRRVTAFSKKRPTYKMFTGTILLVAQ